MLATWGVSKGASGAVLIPAPFASVNGPTQGPSAGPYEGWSAQYTGTPVVANPDGLTPTTFNVTRQGYDATGAAISNVVDLLTVTARVRQPFPNQASNSTNTVSLSDYIYSTDTVAGTVTNNSTFTSPKPVCNWVTPYRQTVGNTLNVEIQAFHRNARNGKQVACVVFTATDAHSHTATQTVTAMTVSGRARDQTSVLVYAGAIDITGLTDGDLITLNAKVYPWIGAAASVMDSGDGTFTALKDFSPRYYLKNVSKATTPPRIYVSTTGVDATAVVSTNDTTARANPALTIQGAMNILKVSGACDGTEIRLQAGTFALNGPSSGAVTQNTSCLTITRDPGVAVASCIVTFASTDSLNFTGFSAPITGPALRFFDVKVVRASNAFISGGPQRYEIIWDNILLDMGGFTANYLNTADDYFYGAAISNAGGGGAWSPRAAGQHRIFRGVSVDAPGTMEGVTVTGNAITNGGTFAVSNGAASDDGTIITCNFLDGTSPATTAWIGMGTGTMTYGAAIVQNVFTYLSSSSAYQMGISNDSNTNNTYNVICHNNTFAGAYIYGRWNVFYDEGVTERTNKLQSFKGNIIPQLNTKGDIFVSDGTRLGNWGFLYGAGCQGQFSAWQDATGGVDAQQAYPGLGANIGTSSTVINDPLFTTNHATTWNGSAATAGSLAGVYTLQGGSPCKLMVSNAVLPFDLAGTARPLTSDSSGAYL